MIELSILEAVNNIKNKKFSAKELLDETFKQIKKVNLNAYISLNEEGAYKQAESVDKGELAGRLAGIPIAIKDNINVFGLKTTCGSLAYEKTAANDAFAVKKLIAEGAVIVGKTNMDEFAMGSSNMTSAFGRALNPIAPDCVTGGSSGGSACAVAACQCFGALGSDTGGSIRQPASYCGIFGLKPTYGAVSKRGMFPLAPSFDQMGPLTRTLEDCRLMFGVIKKDSLAAKEGRIDKNKPIKFGVIKELFADMPKLAKKALESACGLLKECGAEIIEVSVPFFTRAGEVYSVAAYAEMYISLSKIKNRELLGTEAKKRMASGEFYIKKPDLLSEAEQIRLTLAGQIKDALKKCDVIITPTAPSSAFLYSADIKSREVTDSDLYTQPPSVCGLPALSVPFYYENQMPLGVQVIGRRRGEEDIFLAAKLLEA